MSRVVPVLVICLLASGCSFLPPKGLRWGEEEPLKRVLSLGDASHVAAPEGLRATSGEYRVIPLKWDPVLTGDVAGYVIEYATQSEGPFEELAMIEGPGRLGYIDGASSGDPEESDSGPGTALGDGITRFYRVRTFDTESRVSPEASSIVVGTTAPLPDPPSGIIAYSRQPRQMPLSWQSVPGPAVGGYRVERSPGPEGPYEVVAELSGQHTTFHLDTGLGDLRVFYYRVRTTNLSGAAGPPSRSVRAVTKPVPLPPLGLQVSAQRLGVNELRWDANVEEDLVEYELFRIPEEGVPELVATLPVDELTATDTGVLAGQELIYAARARDRDGLVSTHSLPIPVTSEGYDLRASENEKGILLTWNPRADEGFVDALIERSTWLDRGIVYRSHSGQLLDEDVTPGRRYEYVVTLERVDGSLAPASQPVEIQRSESAER